MISKAAPRRSPRRGGAGCAFDPGDVRRDFPALHQSVSGSPLIYLDNAATTQKPDAVIDAMNAYYRRDNANVHRGVHRLSVRATQAYEGARAKAAHFVGAARSDEIIFVRGATEAINLVAQSFVRPALAAGDEIVISHMEHHANIVPWQILCQQTGARLRVVPITDEGELRLEEYERVLGRRTRLVAMTHASNALGTVNPVREVVAGAHARGIPVLIDGAQAVAHRRVDVRTLDCDFYTFSGHKVFGPTGIGVLYAKAEHLRRMPPYQTGGDMVYSVSFKETTYREPPYRFEAGTPNIAGAIGLGAALDYLQTLDWPAVEAHERDLLAYGTEVLSAIPGLRLIGTAPQKAPVLSFVVEGIHPHDLGSILDECGIAIRAGHHCAQPLMERFGVAATARASLAFYNTRAEIEALADAIHRAREVFAP